MLGQLFQYMREYVQCREPKTGQEKVQLYCKDDSLFLSSYYLSMVYSLQIGDNSVEENVIKRLDKW